MTDPLSVTVSVLSRIFKAHSSVLDGGMFTGASVPQLLHTPLSLTCNGIFSSFIPSRKPNYLQPYTAVALSPHQCVQPERLLQQTSNRKQDVDSFLAEKSSRQTLDQTESNLVLNANEDKKKNSM